MFLSSRCIPRRTKRPQRWTDVSSSSASFRPFLLRTSQRRGGRGRKKGAWVEQVVCLCVCLCVREKNAIDHDQTRSPGWESRCSASQSGRPCATHEPTECVCVRGERERVREVGRGGESESSGALSPPSEKRGGRGASWIDRSGGLLAVRFSVISPLVVRVQVDHQTQVRGGKHARRGVGWRWGRQAGQR